MSELPKFRRLEDVQRYLEELSSDIDVTTQVVKKQQALLSKLRNPKEVVRKLFAASFTEFDISPAPRGKRKTGDKTVVAPQITKVVVPNLDKLKHQYGLLEELHGQRMALDSVETQIAMQFPEKRQGPVYEKVVGSLNELRHKVDEQLKQVLEYLSEVAQKHVPKVFSDYTAAVCKGLESTVSFDDSDRYLYVAVDGRTVVFTEYILLVNAVNEDGQVAPHLYIVIKWGVGKGVEVFVEHEFAPPNKLGRGHPVHDAHEAVEGVQGLLAIEGFSAEVGNEPLSLSLSRNPSQLTPADFRARESISKILISEDGTQMDFTFRAGLSADDKKQVTYLVFEDMKAMLKKKRAKLRVKLSSQKVSVFIIAPAQGDNLNHHDVKFLQERFGLADHAVDKIARIINQDKMAKDNIRNAAP